MMLRSQLDAYDDSIPKKFFDLKARASLPVRRDIKRFDTHGWYHNCLIQVRNSSKTWCR